MPALKKKKKALKKRLIKKKVAKGKKKVAKKRIIKRKPVAPEPKEAIIGIVTHYFPKVRVGVVKLKAPLAIGDTVKIKGHTTDFTQTVTSIQINHAPINKAKRGQEIGLLVDSRVRQHDIVYKA